MKADIIDGQVVCGEEAARCRCVKESGHIEAGDLVHACVPGCGGSWTGDHDGDDFEPVTFPSGIVGPI